MKFIPTTWLLAFFAMACSPKEEAKQSVTTRPLITTHTQEAPSTTRIGILGSHENPLKFYLTPSRTSELVQDAGQKLISYLEAETQLQFELIVPENYDEMINAFAQNNGDIALMSSSSYIKAREAYGVTAKLKAIRYGKANYFGQIIASTVSGIKDISDIQNKSIVYTDELSASGYLFPKQILDQQNISPSHTAFAGTHDRVVKMVYKGIADAGATYYSEPSGDGRIRDARSRLIEEFPDVADKVKIIAVTDPIPNDPVVFGQHIARDIYFPVSLGIIKFLETEEGKTAMNELYSIEGYERCKDSDYDGLRAILL
ncbi:hypothetical protein BFP72_17465 [Reichenbachiella sp. 5M10]|uniref:phosphate/phosphite/phosphonate ABC transporter substrate-binding protein n=1 Tax=Reichenbachiella sp. 5M10 TaxID=1889772 RepID=UPI000C157DCF|nr:phosphate/phosphite/phosphonate ABC transporter substrate-binding protein [Reichenbachiella sp. 5M10]PIB37064.1 hypothetical protein BFP72_17465 [Reichenbachiella sp. 5M10]